MNKAAHDTALESAAALLTHYSFDLGGYSTEELIAQWLLDYPSAWVRLATIEALYQGRYKALSVTHILACWKRRNQALYHFNHEFERLVTSQLPKGWKGRGDTPENIASTVGVSELSPLGILPETILSDDFPPLERPKYRHNLPETTAGETPAVATLEEKMASPESPEPLSPEPSAAPSEEQAPAPSNSQTHNPGTKETGMTERPEAIASFSDDLLGDLWLDPPQLQPIHNPKPTFTDLVPSSESAVAIEDPETEDSSEAIANTSPIHQFTPKETSSDFYSKLKAVSQPRPPSPP